MATDVMKLQPTPEDFIVKYNIRLSSYFHAALTSKYTEFMEKIPAETDPRTVTEMYLKVYQLAADSFYPGESASMNKLYILYHSCTIGQRIAQQRQALGLSQTEFGKLINRSLRAVQQYESGAVELGICFLEEIAMKLQINISVLLGLDDPAPEVPSCICNCPLIRVGLLDHVLGEKKNG